MLPFENYPSLWYRYKCYAVTLGNGFVGTAITISSCGECNDATQRVLFKKAVKLLEIAARYDGLGISFNFDDFKAIVPIPEELSISFIVAFDSDEILQKYLKELAAEGIT